MLVVDFAAAEAMGNGTNRRCLHRTGHLHLQHFFLCFESPASSVAEPTSWLWLVFLSKRRHGEPVVQDLASLAAPIEQKISEMEDKP